MEQTYSRLRWDVLKEFYKTSARLFTEQTIYSIIMENRKNRAMMQSAQFLLVHYFSTAFFTRASTSSAVA